MPQKLSEMPQTFQTASDFSFFFFKQHAQSLDGLNTVWSGCEDLKLKPLFLSGFFDNSSVQPVYLANKLLLFNDSLLMLLLIWS